MGFWDSVKKFLARLLAVIAILILVIVLIACLCTGNYAGAVGVAGGLMGMLAWVAANWYLIVLLAVLIGACAMMCDHDAADAVFAHFGRSVADVAEAAVGVVTDVVGGVLSATGILPWLVGGFAAFLLLKGKSGAGNTTLSLNGVTGR